MRQLRRLLIPANWSGALGERSNKAPLWAIGIVSPTPAPRRMVFQKSEWRRQWMTKQTQADVVRYADMVRRRIPDEKIMCYVEALLRDAPQRSA